MTGASDIAVRRFDAVAPGRPMGRAGSKDTGRVACQPTHGRGPSLGPATSPSLQGWGALTINQRPSTSRSRSSTSAIVAGDTRPRRRPKRCVEIDLISSYFT